MDESNQIIVLDNLITGDLKNIEKYKEFSNFKYVKHDIQESIYFDEKIDYVVHLASCASPKAYAKYPINTLKSGSIGTINALGISKYHNAKFFLASTSEIYGDPEISPQSEEYWGNVNTLGPRSMYDESKRFAESATHSYITTHNLIGNIARIFNTYGPNMQIDDGRVVTNFIYQALKGKEITIYGNGEQTRSFSYIDDTLDVSDIFQKKGVFALTVNGDSMIDAFIADGDMVLMEPVDSFYGIKNGTIVSALVPGSGTTLKYFFKKENKIYLEAANSNYEPIILNFEDVTIQGKLLAVWRKV